MTPENQSQSDKEELLITADDVNQLIYRINSAVREHPVTVDQIKSAIDSIAILADYGIDGDAILQERITGNATSVKSQAPKPRLARFGFLLKRILTLLTI